ncbi:MAG: Rossmann-like and DUF2520 domain-containing protein [Flavobacteriaceae bacterium]
MISMVIIGFGNVGQHLYKAFKKEKVKVLQVYSPSLTPSEKKGTQFINAVDDMAQADVYIIAIKDDAIPSFSASLPFENQLVVHTSGTSPMESISDQQRRGVFYPPQTFSKEAKLNWKHIPICIEAEHPRDLELLKKLGGMLSKTVVPLSTEKRQELHLGAVWVNNFSNHLFHLAEDFLKEAQVDFDLLKPLLFETVRKLKKISPAEAQTGPAKRHDQKTMEAHLALLKDPKHKEIYTLLSESIQNKF